jgi:DNA (cytosine-5)-methyltransferase 1
VRYLSVCSGIEAASVAWKPLGWEAVGFSEIEAFPCALLAHRFPTVPNLGDMTRHETWNLAPGSVELLVGGTPCQSFSVAGLRKGLEDPRGNLMLTYLAIALRQRPRWIVWENVPGVLSSNGGRDFGTFLGALGELGYGVAYRVLDAQWFGVAQRRRRVFVVGCLGDATRAAKVLFERESVLRDTPPRRPPRQGVAPDARGGLEGREQWPARIASTLNASFGAKWGLEDQHALSGAPLFVPATWPIQDGLRVEKDQNGLGLGDAGDPMFTLDCTGAQAVAFHPTQDPITSVEVCHALGTGNGSEGATAAVATPFVKAKRAQSVEDHETWEADRPAPTLSVFDNGDTRATVAIVTPAVATYERHDQDGRIREVTVAPTLSSTADNGCELPIVLTHAVTYSTPAIGTIREDSLASTITRNTGAGGETQNPAFVAQPPKMAVRRLTPRECERLQGFPDDWTAIPYRGKPAADGPRYKAIGNSMAVPVMRWIGERIEAVERAQ